MLGGWVSLSPLAFHSCSCLEAQQRVSPGFSLSASPSLDLLLQGPSAEVLLPFSTPARLPGPNLVPLIGTGAELVWFPQPPSDTHRFLIQNVGYQGTFLISAAMKLAGKPCLRLCGTDLDPEGSLD